MSQNKRPELQEAVKELGKVEQFDISEVFADSFVGGVFAEGCIYLTFSAHRIEHTEPGSPANIKNVTSGRLVLTVNAAGSMLNYLTDAFAKLEKDGVLKRRPDIPQTMQ